MTGGEATATVGGAGATGASIGLTISRIFVNEQAAAAVSIGLGLVGVVLISLAIRLGRQGEVAEKPRTMTVVVTPPDLGDRSPEELFEAFQRSLSRRGRAL